LRIILAALVAAFLLPAVASAETASYYGGKFHGRKTASGQIYNQNAHTCAHKTLPFGTRLRVTYQGRSTECTVNDRGPFIAGRDLDLSVACAREIGMTGAGVGRVTITKV
jgi:rare lipoprotein A